MRTQDITKRNKAERNECGQAIVEFALILPVLLILLMGVLDFGWIFMNQYRVEKAASSAARFGAINKAQYDSMATREDYLDDVSDRVADNLAEDASDSLFCEDITGGHLPGTHDPGSTVVCVDVKSNCVSVSVTYPVRTLTFVASTLFGKYYSATSTSVSSY